MNPVVAQDENRQERIAFASGDTRASVQETITGYESVDYLVGSRAGQDILMVGIQNEVYEIPDAVTFGG